jgi:energy-coupling factor transporter ATP-binding protein EcfA2
MMYIRKITLRNVRCFHDDVTVAVTLPAASNPSWTLIVGDNGVGKTTLLRAIGMGLCDETTASGLLRELDGELLRHGEDSGSIFLELEDSDTRDVITVSTDVRRTADGGEDVHQEVTPAKTGFRRGIFACGYGAHRAALGSQVFERYRIDNSLYSLFNPWHELFNPEVVLLRKKENVRARLVRQLEVALMLPPGNVRLGDSGFVVQGPWGRFTPVGSIGDGYASTLSWICDMFGWYSLFRGNGSTEELEGIVLIDELEKHLHPTWQREIIGRLANAFPKIQFIATSHSALIAIGAADLSDSACQIVLLEQGENAVSARGGLPPPRYRRADQVLTSYLFGLDSTTSDDVARDIARYSQLSSRQRMDPHEIAEKERLYDQLADVLIAKESSLQETVRRAVHDTLRKMATQDLDTFDPEALDFEIRRQLSAVFGDHPDTP